VQIGRPEEHGEGDRDGDGHDEAGQAEQDADRVDLSDLILRQVTLRDDGRAQPELVDECHEREIRRGHADEAVVRRHQQANHHDRADPAEDLAEPLDGARPRDAADQRAIE
jgi:hypothetical protein